MVTGKVILGSAFAALVAVTPGAAQQVGDASRSASADTVRARETNQAMLDALLKRRAEAVQSAGAADSKRAVLRFLDRQIAKVRRDLRG